MTHKCNESWKGFLDYNDAAIVQETIAIFIATGEETKTKDIKWKTQKENVCGSRMVIDNREEKLAIHLGW